MLGSWFDKLVGSGSGSYSEAGSASCWEAGSVSYSEAGSVSYSQACWVSSLEVLRKPLRGAAREKSFQMLFLQAL